MTSPYINTELYTHISLHPNQMDNKLYVNLKKNLEKKVSKKCFKDKGYLMEIFKITDYKDGVIEPENLTGSAIFDVKFSCRLCVPLVGQELICKVNRVNKLLITVINGPILIIITNERVNDTIFFTDNNNNLRYKKDKKSHILEPNEFVKVTIISKTFNNGDDKIKAIGYLNNIANDEEIESFYNDVYNKDDEIVDYDEFITLESK